MKIILLSLSAALISLSASAETANWELVKQTAGPNGWDCPQSFQSDTQTDKIVLLGNNFSQEIDSLNEGVLCSRRQNGAIFGHLSCTTNTFETVGNKATYGMRQCGSDLPFISHCDPTGEDFSKKIEITGNKTLVYSGLTGWQDGPVFECRYKRN